VTFSKCSEVGTVHSGQDGKEPVPPRKKDFRLHELNWSEDIFKIAVDSRGQFSTDQV